MEGERKEEKENDKEKCEEPGKVEVEITKAKFIVDEEPQKGHRGSLI